VDLGDRLRVQVVAGRAGVAGVWAAAGHPGADHQYASGHDRDDPAERADRRGYGQPGRPVRFEGAPPERVRRRDHRHRGQEVQPDHPRVEVGEHRQPADHRLRRDAERGGDGEQSQGPAPGALPPRGDHRGDDHGGEREGEQAVAELDHPVHAHLGGRHVRLVGTAGPGRAAETGFGQSDGAAGPNDQHVTHHGGESQPR
jgi:hypothetical protein